MLLKGVKGASLALLLAGYLLLGKMTLEYPSQAELAAARLQLTNILNAMASYNQDQGTYPQEISASHPQADLLKALAPYLQNLQASQQSPLGLVLLTYQTTPTGFQMIWKLKRKKLIVTENGLSE